MYPCDDDRWCALVGGGSATPAVHAQSVRGARMLADRLTVDGWREQVTVDGRKVVSQLSVSCPDPTGSLTAGPDAPLGWMGQRIVLRAGFAHRGAPWLIPMGQWRVDDPGADAPAWVDYHGMTVRRGTVVQPSASDLLTVLEDDLPWLTGPLPGGTVQSEIVRLIEGRIPVAATWSAVDGSMLVPAQVYADNRLTAICDLLALVGGVAWTNRAGAFEPLAAESTGVDWVIPVGAVVSALAAGGRDGLFNRVIVTGTDDDGVELRAIVSEESGPFSVYGDFGVVTRTYSNPLGKTQLSLDLTAATYLRQGIDGRSVRYSIELTTPNWALDPLDRVQLTDPDGRTVTGPVTAITRGPDGMSLEVPVPYAEVWPDAVAL